jgi:hypothetical protein
MYKAALWFGIESPVYKNVCHTKSTTVRVAHMKIITVKVVIRSSIDRLSTDVYLITSGT